MAINTSGILKSPQGSAIQNAEIIFEQTRTSTEVLAGTKFSVITNQTGNYSSSLGVGTYVFKVRFQDETQYRTVASNVIVTQSMNNYSLNQIIQDQSQLQDVDYNLLQDVIQARDQAAASKQAAQSSQAAASTKASEASSSAQAALASKNAAQTSEANALASKNAAQTSQTNADSSQTAAANSQTAAANSQTTSTTKATEASNSAQAALASKNAAQTSETNALASKNAAQASQTTASTKASEASTSQAAASTKAGEAATSQTQAQQSQSDAADSASQANTSKQQAQQSQTSASTSQATATTKATEASNSAQAALASKNAAQTSETNALSSKNQAQTSQTNAASSQTAAAGSQTTASTKASQAATSQTQAQQSQGDAGAAASQADNSAQQAQQSQASASTSQTTATTKASEASSSAQAALASKNAAQTSETNALSSKNAAQTSQTSASGSQTAASTSQAAASTKAGEASTSQTNAAASQTTASTKAGEASTSQTNAAASQTTATTKAGEASSSQTAAAGSQSTATTKATEATNSATLAQKWAANPENSVVSGGLYSALHYAAKAAQSAQTASGQLVWRGGWSAQAGTAPPTPTGTTQDFYRITQAGTILSVQYEIGDYIHWDNINSIWFKMDGTDSVISVNGRTGAVVVTKTDVGLSAVNNWGASSQTNDASTTTYATTAGVKAAYDLAATKLAATANAVSATKLVTARTINGTSFDGTGNITTVNWGTARTLTIGNSGKSVNGGVDVSWSLSEIGAARARGELSSGATENITTDQFVQWLKDSGAFDERVWIARGSWSYANNKTITDTGCGNIHLAGCTIEVISSGEFAFTIRIITPTTTSGGGTTGAEFVYVNNGSAYSPGWRRIYTTAWKPNADDVGALPSGGTAVAAAKLATARTIGGVAFDGTANIDLPGVNTAGNQSTTGNAATATKLATARTISGVAFDGTANITLTAANVGAIATTGGTATGNITAPDFIQSSAQSTNAASCTRKDYVDSAIAAGDALQVSKAGDSMLGQLILTPGFVDTSVNAQLAHIGKDATKPLYIRNMREHTSSSWLWEKVYNGSLYYSSGTNGSGTNKIRLQVSGSGEIYLGENADKRVYHEGFKPTAGEIGALQAGSTAVAATKLATARTIGGVSFDGTANINLPGVNTTGNQSTTGNAATATKLATARTISGVAFDGTADITLSAADVGALPLTGGTVSGGVIGSYFRPSGTVGGSVGLVGGNGDGATLTTNNIRIETWWGFGIWCTQGTPGYSHSFDARSGTTVAKGDYYAQTDKRVYHQGFKPTAADIDAVNKTGDTMTGSLIMRGSQSHIRFQHTSHNGGDLIWERDNAGVMEQQARMWSSSPTKLHLCAGSGTSESGAGVLTINASNEMFIGGSPVYTAANKPTAGEIGALQSGATAVAATKLATARTISGVAFDGSANITLTAANVGAIPTSGGDSTGRLTATVLGVTNLSNSSGDGLSLYGQYSGGKPSYGMMFAGTATFGSLGAVYGDWATYFTMSGTADRGWIFKHVDSNVASISGNGRLTLNAVNDGIGVHVAGQRQGDSVGLIRGEVQGGAYVDWRARAAGLLVDCQQSSGSAHNIFKATHWGVAHLCAMDVHRPAGGQTQVMFHVGGNSTFGFHENGQLHAGDVYIRSDRRLKSNFSQITGALSKVLSLEGSTYDKKWYLDADSPVTREAGIVAQDLQQALPEAVRENVDGMLTISNSAVNALLLEAIKELKAEVDHLRRLINGT